MRSVPNSALSAEDEFLAAKASAGYSSAKVCHDMFINTISNDIRRQKFIVNSFYIDSVFGFCQLPESL